MLMIRLQRIGRPNDPRYRIAVRETAPETGTGRIVEGLGSYNPKTKAFVLDEVAAKEWMAHGAQPTDTLRNLFIAKCVLTGKQVDVFPTSARKKARLAAEKAEADAVIAAKATEEKKAVAAKVAVEAVAAPIEEAAVPEVAPVEVPAPAGEPPVPVVHLDNGTAEDGTGPS